MKPLTLLCALTGLMFTAASLAAEPEIHLFEVSQDGVFTQGKNITQSPGYDNQPFFLNNSQSFVYVSDRGDGQTDVYRYDLKSKKTTQLTKTPASEYSPRPGKDKNSINFIYEGGNPYQSVYRMDNNTGEYSWMLQQPKAIGYYSWNDQGDALLWLRNAYALHHSNPGKKSLHFVSGHVAPSIPFQIPGSQQFSFIHQQSNLENWIKAYNPDNRAIRPLVQPLASTNDYCWTPTGSILMAKGAEIFEFNPASDSDWRLRQDLSSFGLKKISRMAMSPDGKHIAIVDSQ
jgi:hypothetical protein